MNTVAAAVTGRTADFAGEDFGEMFEHALKAGRYEARLAECRRRNAAGGDVRYGVGLAAVVETSGTGPFESAKVILTAEGRIELAAGATSLGQGLPTTLAQVCADVIQVPPADIAVHLGDTRWIAARRGQLGQPLGGDGGRRRPSGRHAAARADRGARGGALRGQRRPTSRSRTAPPSSAASPIGAAPCARSRRSPAARSRPSTATRPPRPSARSACTSRWSAST